MKNNISVFCPQQAHFQYNNTDRLKIQWLENIYHANNNQKKANGYIYKIDFGAKTFARDWEAHSIITNGQLKNKVRQC